MTQNAINNSASSLDVDNVNINGNTISSTDTNGNIILTPNGTGTVSLTNGLSFDGGTNVLSNFTDDTSWTPQLEFGAATTGITYANRSGNYSRIGNVVFFRYDFNLTSKGSATGNARLTGLPLSSSTNNSINIGRLSGLTLDANYVFPFFLISGDAILDIFQAAVNGAGSIALDDTNFGNFTGLGGIGIYFI